VLSYSPLISYKITENGYIIENGNNTPKPDPVDEREIFHREDDYQFYKSLVDNGS
jgi:hypothetical protein